MRARPILFSGPMILALMRPSPKTQTRRLAQPRWAVGDLLYVREEFSGPHAYAAPERIPPRDWQVGCPIHYWAGGEPESGDWTKPKPGMHMPRWCSRITFKVAEVRQEQLNAISEADALAEGVVHDPERGFIVPGVKHPNADFPYLSRATARGMYAALWDVINGSGSWLGDPPIWVTRFEPPILQNVDAYLTAHGA